VLNTAAAAAIMGFKVVLPVDSVSAAPPPAPPPARPPAPPPGGIGPNVTLTRIDMIKF
jgi:hypothetical protein